MFWYIYEINLYMSWYIYEIHLCMLPGPCGTQRDPGRGEEKEDFSVPPALATAESRLRAHTASRRDHVTDTEHDFPVGGDGQAGLTTPKPPIF